MGSRPGAGGGLVIPHPNHPTLRNHLPFPQAALVELFAKTLHDAFGHQAFLVGSATAGKNYRDVDIRLILEDAEYAQQFPPEGARPASLNLRREAMGAAFSYYGRQLTGLPIDFQIQQQSLANELYDGPRLALGLGHGLWAFHTVTPAAEEPSAENPLMFTETPGDL